MTLPAGTVTLLLADIESSTALWEQRGDEMPTAIAALDDVVDGAVLRYKGARPVEQGEGDSFVAAFSLASDAVACALALQRATAESPLRLRIGIHTAEVQLPDEGNYVGPAINRAARVRDAGHGGQILLSHTAADLVADQLSADTVLDDLGEHGLRDLGRPERIFQLSHSALRHDFPPLRAMDAVRNNLPVQLTNLVGRVRESSEVQQLLDDARALTLTGAGGCGKTRLALQVAADRLDSHPGGVWLVDLAPLNDPGDVVRGALAAMSIYEQAGREPIDVLTRAIGTQPMLIVLDNCEHLIAPSAELAEQLLRTCARVTLLATSREPLGITSEVTYRVPSLGVPAASEGIEGLRHFDAVELFVECARRARPGFVLDASTAPPVTEICRRLDGIPLALELAAARVRVLTVEQIRDGLHDRFRLLTGGARTAVPRQQTLRASVDWSYALLLDAERTLLHRLSVFAGGFTLDAALDVGAGGSLEPHHILDLLGQLVDKSLVVADDTDGRFALLETVRQYAASRLVDAGEAEEVRRRHFEHFLASARWRYEEGESDDDYRARVAADYDNVRRALQWAADENEVDGLARLTHRLYSYWRTGARIVEGVSWLGRVLDMSDDAAIRGRVVGDYAHTRGMSGDWGGALEFAQEAVELARDGDDKARLALALTQLHNVAINLGHSDSDRYTEEAISLATEAGEDRAKAWALFQVGLGRAIRWGEGDVEPFEEAIEVARRARYHYVERMAVTSRGYVYINTGEVRRGRAYMEEGMALLYDARDWWYLANALAFYAATTAWMGDQDAADATALEMARLELEAGYPQITDFTRYANAAAAQVRGDWARVHLELTELPNLYHWLVEPVAVMAQALSGDVVGARAHIEARTREPRPVRVASTMSWSMAEAVLERLSGNLGLAADIARTTLVDQPHPTMRLPYVIILAGLIGREGRYEDAARVFGAASVEADRVGLAFHGGLFNALDDGQLEATRRSLDDGAFARAWAEGTAMSFDDVVAYLQRGRGERKRPATGWASLTPTEQQVVDLVAEGLANKEIAARLFMSVPTVKSHLTHSYAKLGYSSRAELIAAAAAR